MYGAVEEDLRSEEGVVFAEVSLVKNKQELDTVVQSLDRVGNAALKRSVLCGASHQALINLTYGGKNQTSPAVKSSTNVSPFSLTA